MLTLWKWRWTVLCLKKLVKVLNFVLNFILSCKTSIPNFLNSLMLNKKLKSTNKRNLHSILNRNKTTKIHMMNKISLENLDSKVKRLNNQFINLKPKVMKIPKKKIKIRLILVKVYSTLIAKISSKFCKKRIFRQKRWF